MLFFSSFFIPYNISGKTEYQTQKDARLSARKSMKFKRYDYCFEDLTYVIDEKPLYTPLLRSLDHPYITIRLSKYQSNCLAGIRVYQVA